MNEPGSHDARVGKVASTVAEAYRNKQQLYIFHGLSNTTREVDFTKKAVVDISGLNKILEINEHQRYAVVEPNVTMDELLAATLPLGLMPPVVMEFPKITVGGGIQGGAGESSSFRYGGFHQCCDEYEIIIGNGDIKTVSRNNDAELFWGLACSYGSLAIITKIKLRLVKALPNVRLHYIPVRNAEQIAELFRQKRSDPTVNFLDAIMFSKTSGVVMVGEMTEETTSRAITFSRQNDEWFYLHVQKKLGNKNLDPDFIPLPDYLFRYNRGAFWVGRFFFSYCRLPFLKSTRRLFDR